MSETPETTSQDFDYSYVPNAARIAIYDDLLSSPRIVDIDPTTTREFINNLASAIYEHASKQGGTVPFSIILQVAENFIHAQFSEIVVSIMDSGNTIRFTDQGPGISDKEKAQRPGYSSATAPMKHYIHGVGSGLPIVREYLETKHGTIHIEDNMDTGAVVTISLAPDNGDVAYCPTSPQNQDNGDVAYCPTFAPATSPNVSPDSKSGTIGYVPVVPVVPPNLSHLSKDEIKILKLFLIDDVWGVKNIAAETGIPVSTAHNKLNKLLEAGIMARLGTKWILSDLGNQVVNKLK